MYKPTYAPCSLTTIIPWIVCSPFFLSKGSLSALCNFFIICVYAYYIFFNTFPINHKSLEEDRLLCLYIHTNGYYIVAVFYFYFFFHSASVNLFICGRVQYGFGRTNYCSNYYNICICY